MGDFNFPDINWDTWSTPTDDTNSIEFQFIEAVRDAYLYQHVTLPTRGRIGQVPHLLDLILTNEESMISELEHQSPLGKSDHAVLLFKYHCYTLPARCKVKKLCYNKGDYETMNAQMRKTDWNTIFSGNNVEQNWKIFKNTLCQTIDQHIPTRMVNDESKHRNPVTKEELEQIRKKHRLWEKFITSRTNSDHRSYTKSRNKVRRMTRNNEREKERDLAKNVKLNPKAFWRHANSKLKVRSGVPNLRKSPGSSDLTESDSEKAEVLNAFFSSVYNIEPPGEIPTIEQKTCTSQWKDPIITEEIVRKKLRQLKIDKSQGPDNLHPRVLKELADSIAKPVYLLFTQSLTEKKLPSEWKVGHITPIYKKGSKQEPGNYRPVSLTCILAKVMEKFIRDSVMTFMQENSFFTDYQFGFISKRSTMLQMLRMMEDWNELLDNDESIDVAYMDFMKAFDKVPHRRLLGKLEAYGIQQPVLGWITDFLSERKQCVVVNGEQSTYKAVSSGIPQGSVLGPLLFVVYINDMPEVIDKDSIVYLFADDTKLFRVVNNVADSALMQRDIDALKTWSDTWLMPFNKGKCSVMSLGKREETFTYTMTDGEHQTEITKSAKEKDVGVIVDDRLTFEYHIQEKINKANSTMAVIRRTYTYLDQTSFRYLFKGLVRPSLEYCNSVWRPYKVKDITAIENVQRRATKLVPGLQKLEYEDRLKKLGLPTLQLRGIRGDMIECYKILHGVYDTKVTSGLLDLAHNQRTRGHTYKLEKPRFKKTPRKYSFRHRVINVWNALPESVVTAPSLNSFKRRLDRHWKDQDLQTDYRAHLTGSKGELVCSEDEDEEPAPVAT